MNWRAAAAIYRFEMARTARTIGQSIVSPVLDLALFRGVRRRDRFGHPGDRGVSYGAFIVPGLIMLTC